MGNTLCPNKSACKDKCFRRCLPSLLSTLISHCFFTRFILFYLVDVCLHKCAGGQDERMYSEKDVICTDKVLLAVVSTLVLFLNLGTEKKCQVENLDSNDGYETKVSVVN
jgi:hypothetical protein